MRDRNSPPRDGQSSAIDLPDEVEDLQDNNARQRKSESDDNVRRRERRTTPSEEARSGVLGRVKSFVSERLIRAPLGGGGGDDTDDTTDDDTDTTAVIPAPPGGGGGDGGDDDTEDDASHIALRNMRWLSPSKNTLRAEFDMVNVIDSGDGEGLPATADVTVDGTREADVANFLSPGESVSKSVTVSGVSAGSHELCIDDTGDDISGFCQTVEVAGDTVSADDIAVTDCASAEGQPGAQGEQLVTVQNDADQLARATLTVTADGEILGENSKLIDPGTSQQNVIYTLPDEKGTYNFAIEVTSAEPAGG